MGTSALLTTAGEVVGLRPAFASITIAFSVYKYVWRRREYEADRVFGEKHGCRRREIVLPYSRSLALDLFKKQYNTFPSQRRLAFQSQYFDQIGPNMRFRLFGADGFLTTDPKILKRFSQHTLRDFALSESPYAIVKIIQAFPNLRLPPEIEKEKTGQEKESLTIMVTSA